jgi:hypothetical protein
MDIAYCLTIGFVIPRVGHCATVIYFLLHDVMSRSCPRYHASLLSMHTHQHLCTLALLLLHHAPVHITHTLSSKRRTPFLEAMLLLRNAQHLCSHASHTLTRATARSGQTDPAQCPEPQRPDPDKVQPQSRAEQALGSARACSGLRRHQARKPARDAGAPVLRHGVGAHVQPEEGVGERLRLHHARLRGAYRVRVG